MPIGLFHRLPPGIAVIGKPVGMMVDIVIPGWLIGVCRESNDHCKP
jgi:hypothetical protein